MDDCQSILGIFYTFKAIGISNRIYWIKSGSKVHECRHGRPLNKLRKGGCVVYLVKKLGSGICPLVKVL